MIFLAKFTTELSNSKHSFQNSKVFFRRLPDETKSAPLRLKARIDQTANTSGPETSFVFHRMGIYGHWGCSAQVVFMKTFHTSASASKRIKTNGTPEILFLCQGLEDDVFLVTIVLWSYINSPFKMYRQIKIRRPSWRIKKKQSRERFA